MKRIITASFIVLISLASFASSKPASIIQVKSPQTILKKYEAFFSAYPEQPTPLGRTLGFALMGHFGPLVPESFAMGVDPDANWGTVNIETEKGIVDVMVMKAADDAQCISFYKQRANIFKRYGDWLLFAQASHSITEAELDSISAQVLEFMQTPFEGDIKMTLYRLQSDKAFSGQWISRELDSYAIEAFFNADDFELQFTAEASEGSFLKEILDSTTKTDPNLTAKYLSSDKMEISSQCVFNDKIKAAILDKVSAALKDNPQKDDFIKILPIYLSNFAMSGNMDSGYAIIDDGSDLSDMELSLKTEGKMFEAFAKMHLADADVSPFSRGLATFFNGLSKGLGPNLSVVKDASDGLEYVRAKGDLSTQYATTSGGLSLYANSTDSGEALQMMKSFAETVREGKEVPNSIAGKIGDSWIYLYGSRSLLTGTNAEDGIRVGVVFDSPRIKMSIKCKSAFIIEAYNHLTPGAAMPQK